MEYSFGQKRICVYLLAAWALPLLLSGCDSVDEMAPASPGGTPPTIRPPDLVEIRRLDPTIKLDLRYATSGNILGRPLYKSQRALLQRPIAEALVRAHKRLKAKGFGIVMLDAYRPWSVTRELWNSLPSDKKPYFADPRKGSIHNNGCAVDVTLYELSNGKTVEMPSGYDEFGPAARLDFQGGLAAVRSRRDLLLAAMVSEGFLPCNAEWWHYNHKDWASYQIIDMTL